MPEPGKYATAGPAFDWSATDLGAAAAWPPGLRLAVDLVHNTPLPTLLLWGARRIVVYNKRYAEFAGLRPGSVPGGHVPAILPGLLNAAPGAVERALAGESLHLERVHVATLLDGRPVQSECDLHLTPVPDADGKPGGVLCVIGVSQAKQEEADTALRILVVEDNLDSQYLVCEMLKAFGHEADGVGHAEGALNMLAERRYDVLFSDVSLPGMSGVDMARQAVARQPSLKVIFASGYGDALLRHVEFAHQSLQKPYELEHLQQALARISGPPLDSPEPSKRV